MSGRNGHAMIRMEHVRKVFDGSGAPAIGDLSLEIPEGAILALVGPSGCGKTTALRLINRLVEPSGGRIEVGGRDVMAQEPHELRRSIGYVIQQAGLFPHRSVADNIATVPRLLGWEDTRVRARVGELMTLVGLDLSMRDRYPAELSGGQQQRVGVARALAADPPILLMDEPFGAVDPIVRSRLQDELLALQQRLRKTVVFVTHDIDEALKLGDRIAILNTGGVLEQYGAPAEILKEPANAFVEQFLGGERGLKRLALMPVASMDLKPGPVAQAGTSIENARSLMREHDVDWLGVLEGPLLMGWASADEIERAGAVPGDGLHAFGARLDPESTLRAALDEIVLARTPVAVVCAPDRYLGMITLDDVRTAIAE